MKLVTPNGTEIIGTYEKTPGCALIQDPRRRPDGSLEWDYSGETKMYWNDQETQKNEKGEVLFVDDQGEEWAEGELKLIDD